MLLNMERNKVHYKHLIPFFYGKGKNGIQVANKMAHKRCGWNYTPLSTTYLWVISSIHIHMYFLYVLYIYIFMFVICFCIYFSMLLYIFYIYVFVYVILLCSPTCIFTSVLTLCKYILSVSTFIYIYFCNRDTLWHFSILYRNILFLNYSRFICCICAHIFDHDDDCLWSFLSIWNYFITL